MAIKFSYVGKVSLYTARLCLPITPLYNWPRPFLSANASPTPGRQFCRNRPVEIFKILGAVGWLSKILGAQASQTLKVAPFLNDRQNATRNRIERDIRIYLPLFTKPGCSIPSATRTYFFNTASLDYARNSKSFFKKLLQVYAAFNKEPNSKA